MKQSQWKNKGNWKGFKKLNYEDLWEKKLITTANKISKPLRRTKLRRKGKSATTLIKDEIQALLREIVIKRDGGCVLGKYLGNCNEVLQAEHLVTRSATNYFGDLRNVVCLCSYHHIFWKPQYSKMYWTLIERHLGPTKWNWYLQAEADNRPYKVDLKLVKLALQNELKKYDRL